MLSFEIVNSDLIDPRLLNAHFTWSNLQKNLFTGWIIIYTLLDCEWQIGE